MEKYKLIWKSKILDVTDTDKGIRIRLVDNVVIDFDNIDSAIFTGLYYNYDDYVKIPLNARLM